MTHTGPIRTFPGAGDGSVFRLRCCTRTVAVGSCPLVGELLATWERTRPSRKGDRVGGASRLSILKPGDSICISGFT